MTLTRNGSSFEVLREALMMWRFPCHVIGPVLDSLLCLESEFLSLCPDTRMKHCDFQYYIRTRINGLTFKTYCKYFYFYGHISTFKKFLYVIYFIINISWMHINSFKICFHLFPFSLESLNWVKLLWENM